MVDVEIWSDVVCPFCFIGKRRFEEALAQFPQRDQVRVTWRSFELDPHAVKNSGRNIHEVLSMKYGRDLEWARQMTTNMTAQAAELGLDFRFDAVVPTNSFDAHRLAHLASQQGKQDEIHERLFSAYFTEGKDIAKHEILREIGRSVGLGDELIEPCLQSDQFKNEVRAEEDAAARLGLTGVPAFVFNKKYLVSGAQDPEIFLQVLERSASDSGG
jgi:predicted DsbA family dithiol-disulfide isomerase